MLSFAPRNEGSGTCRDDSNRAATKTKSLCGNRAKDRSFPGRTVAMSDSLANSNRSIQLLEIIDGFPQPLLQADFRLPTEHSLGFRSVSRTLRKPSECSVGSRKSAWSRGCGKPSIISRSWMLRLLFAKLSLIATVRPGNERSFARFPHNDFVLVAARLLSSRHVPEPSFRGANESIPRCRSMVSKQVERALSPAG